MFFENDRTWCSNFECNCNECYRNASNMVGRPKFFSIADFEGTKECIKEKNEKWKSNE